MIKLQGNKVYLATLERKDCKKLYEDFEYDFDNPSEMLNIGHSVEKSDEWFDEIQKLQGKENIRLGIFQNDGTFIGDVALQGIDHKNRSCSIGMGMAKLENRNKGYGKQAVTLILEYGFKNLGMERITANTLEINISAQKSLEGAGFTLEGRERKAEYFGGKKYDRLNYSLLAEEYLQKGYAMNRKIYTSNEILSFVEYQKSDDRALYENWQDPEMQRGYNGIYFTSFEEFEKRDSLRGRFFAMIRLNSTNEIIGSVGISPPETEPDLAIWIFGPYRRQGYGTSAFALATKYAMDELNIPELHAGAYPDNIGSQKMLKKCGYIPYPAGNIPEKHYITGEDIIQMDYIWKEGVVEK